MSKPLSILDALKGAPSIVRQLRYQFTCPTCGRDNGMSAYPFPITCDGFNCWTEIEAAENPLYLGERRS